MQANTGRYERMCMETNLLQETLVTAVRTLQVHEGFVILQSGGAFNLTMPSVAAAMGHEYTIWHRTLGGTVTVVAPDAVGFVNLALDTAGDVVRMKSNGVSWDVAKQGVA